jgi:prepilin-type N-terminal cleavage/methylation domain-containing protein
MSCAATLRASRRRGSCGMTLVELMVGVAISSIILALASSMWLFGSRSFAAISNYADLDARSRTALDLMSREIRQASRVIAFQNTGTTRWLTVTNVALGTGSTYKWDATPRTLVCQRPGQPDQVYLTECDRWDLDLFQRAPQKGGAYAFYPATNMSGAYDLSICKLVNMSWKCSRTILGNKVNTESVQTAQIVLRNKQ